jgi:hypothetical protein
VGIGVRGGRDRLAADLQSSVVQRIFVAGREPAERAGHGLENRMTTEGLPHRILQLCAEVSPVPEITFAGPVDDALAAEASDQVLGMLRTALGLLGTPAGPALVSVEAAERLSVIVTGTGTPGRHRYRGRVGRRRDQAGLERSATSVGRRSPLGKPNDPDQRA